MYVCQGENMFVGENTATRSKGSADRWKTLLITNATYQRFRDNNSPIDSQPLAAQVTDGDVFAEISAGNVIGQYYVIFSFQVELEVIKAKLSYRVANF